MGSGARVDWLIGLFTMNTFLTSSQLTSYERDGFLVVENFAVHDMEVVLEHPDQFRIAVGGCEASTRNLEVANDVEGWRAHEVPSLQARVEHQKAPFAEPTQRRLRCRRVTIRECRKFGIDVDRLAGDLFATRFGEVLEQCAPVSAPAIPVCPAVHALASEAVGN